MLAYRVEIFDEDFICIHHDVTDDIEYTFDYLVPTSNVVIVDTNNDIKVGNYVHIVNDNNEFFGIIDAIDWGLSDGSQMELSYKPFTSLFNTTIVFDTDLQGSGTSLEVMLRNQILAHFVNNTDALANISILGSISVESNTTNWGFNLKSDTEGMHHTIINLYDVLIIKAFQKYGVVINIDPDFSARKINLVIGKVSANPRIIEADLPSVIDKSIMVHQTQATTNKLTVYNASNYTSTIVYYLHPDGSYNTSNTNRIIPVFNVTKSVAPEEGKTFTQLAAAEASETFGNITYENLIELLVLNDDTLIDAKSIQIGQEVTILSNGVPYESILSGKEIGLNTKLVFGSVRIDLTKLIITGGINTWQK